MVSETESAFEIARQEEGGLNERQREILDLIERGHTNREIADHFQMTLDGAKWHVSEILTKLGLATREEAAEYWRWRQRRVGPRFVRRLGALVAMPVVRWVGVGVGVAAVGVVAMVALSQGESSSPRVTPSHEGIALVITSDQAHELIVYDPLSRQVTSRVALSASDARPQGAGAQILFQGFGTMTAMRLDGSHRRQIYSAPDGKTIVSADSSPDGHTLAIIERHEDGSDAAVVFVDADSGVVRSRVVQDLKSFPGFVGTFQQLWWHPDNKGVTVGSDSGSLALIEGLAPSPAPVSNFVGQISVSPSGLFVAEVPAADPSCHGFLRGHQLRIVEVASGRVVAQMSDPVRGVALIGWIADSSGLFYESLPTAACGPAEDNATVQSWRLPLDGTSPVLLGTSPYPELALSAALPAIIELDCGDGGKRVFGQGVEASPPWLRGLSMACAGSGFGGPIPTGTSAPTPTPRAAGASRLFIDGRDVGPMDEVYLAGLIDLN